MGLHYDIAGDVVTAIEAAGDAQLVTVGIKLILEKGPSWIAKIRELYGTIKNIRPFQKFIGDCLGARSKGGPLTPGSCDSHHGIYWQFHYPTSSRYPYHLYNTFLRDYMTEPISRLANDEWLKADPLRKGEWFTWEDFTNP